ncbi:MAG TPA: adenine deaminase [Patescibacteria group bacterium]|nr:adenine deaminase [Patescibacteria group bacterium]
MSIEDKEQRIDVALGNKLADLVIKNVTILNVATGSMDKGDIAIKNGKIVGTYDDYHSDIPNDSGVEVIDGTGLTAAPGFIDTHIHIESTLLTPYEFDRCALPLGTTTVMCDPHEIANVIGKPGIKYFLDAAENTLMDIFVQLSPCVPATKMETSGAVLKANDLLEFKNYPSMRDRPRVFGLAEFMDIGGIAGKDPDAMAKLEGFEGEHVGGHAPNVRGKLLNTVANFICDCHESTSHDEGWEKLQKGLRVLIREGTAAKNLAALFNLITNYTAPRLGFCSDDRKPTDMRREGHIDHLIRTAIKMAIDQKPEIMNDPDKRREFVAAVYRIATLSAAEGYGLEDRGLIAPGRRADIVLLSDVESCKIASVIKDGKVITEESFKNRKIIDPVGYDSVHLKEVTAADFAVKGKGKTTVDVIGLIPNEIVTKHLHETMPLNGKNEIQPDPARDILKIAVLERHHNTGNIGRSFVQGFGVGGLTLASTIGHDSHNITVVGAKDEDMAIAVNKLREIQGGFVVVKDGKVAAEVPLPVAGLMSDQPYETVIKQLDEFSKVVSPKLLLLMSFLSLSVIPNLKVNDWGLMKFDPANGDTGPHMIEDQRVPKLAP